MRSKSISIPARKKRKASPKVESASMKLVGLGEAEQLRADDDPEEDLGDDDRQPRPSREVGEHRGEHGDGDDDEDVGVIDLQLAASLFAAPGVSTIAASGTRERGYWRHFGALRPGLSPGGTT